MIEQEINFEIAKLAKQKNFIKQSHYFGYIDKFYEPKTQNIRSFGLHGRTKLKDLIYIPKREELRKWFLERYYLNIIILPRTNNKWTYVIHYIHKYYEWDDTINNILHCSNDSFDSYNEAFDEGLVEMLNII